MRLSVRPHLAEGFPVARVDVVRAKHVPHGHLVRTCIRGGYLQHAKKNDSEDNQQKKKNEIKQKQPVKLKKSTGS